MKNIIGSVFLKTAAFSSVFLLGACSNKPNDTAITRGDIQLSDFYVPPPELPDSTGVLLRQELLTETQSLASAGKNIRILYTSTEGLVGNEINTVSGAFYVPEGPPPEGGWPLLVWSHGTVGIGDKCAPSYSGRSDRDRTYLNPWLENGFAIAASDYQGLGTPGTHPYMDSRTMAYNNLDLIRAVQSGGFPISDRVVLAGQSQGATGVIATAGYAANYAPEIELRGVMATGIPYFSRKIVMGLSKNSDPDAVDPSLGLILYMLTLTEQIAPGFSLDDKLTDAAKPIVSKIGDLCVFDFMGEVSQAKLTSRKTFSGRTEFALMKTFRQMQYPDIKLDVPLFTGSGTADKITPFDMQRAFIDDACRAGSTIRIKTYDGANHNQGLLQSTEDAMAFANSVLTDTSIESNCPVP